GMLRGSGVAGADIGRAFRAISKRALAAGAFRPLPLWLGAFGLIAITTLLSGSARTTLVAILSILAVALVITNLRAAYLAAGEFEQRRMRWLVLGFVTAGAILLIASLPLLFFQEPLAQIPALVLLMLAPAAIIVGLAMAVLYRGHGDARHLLARLPTFSALVLALLLVFALAVTFLGALVDRGAHARSWTLAGALIVTAALFPVLRTLVSSAVDHVLERRPG
ncbi:MAG TPA: hypothetical protein VFO52_07245, partial [Longimicrobiales bacterium]|nr:hypothetical protein [Longimicrobiales bacterium]